MVDIVFVSPERIPLPSDNCHNFPLAIHPDPMQFISFGEGRPCDSGLNQALQFPFTGHGDWFIA